MNFLFTSNAFSVPSNVQVINDYMFPAVLFGVIFTVLCALFFDTDTASSLTVNVDEEEAPVIVDEDCALSQYLSNAVAVMEQYAEASAKPTTKLYDVEQECTRLSTLGARVLRAYCKHNKIKGYSIPANSGVKALAQFMIQHRITAFDVEEFNRSKSVA